MMDSRVLSNSIQDYPSILAENVSSGPLQDSNSTVLWPSRSSKEVSICATILIMIIQTALLGNTAVIYAIATTQKLREHNSNLFIINLSITDMSNALIVMCTAFVMLTGDFRTLDQTWCDICCAFNYILIIVSMLTLAFISIDRYFAVIHPLRYHVFITKKRVLTMITWAWFQGIIFGFAPVIKKWVHYDYWEVVCAITWHEDKPHTTYYVICAFIICFLVPGIIMLLCYFSIIKEAKRCKAGPPQAGLPKGQRSATKTIRSLLVVVALFFICMTPFCVTKLLKVIFTDPKYVPPYANLVSSYMGYFSSVINPFIYGIFRADFRAAYKQLFWRMSCGWCGHRPNPPAFQSSFYTKTRRSRNHSINSITGKLPCGGNDLDHSDAQLVPHEDTPSSMLDAQNLYAQNLPPNSNEICRTNCVKSCTSDSLNSCTKNSSSDCNTNCDNNCNTNVNTNCNSLDQSLVLFPDANISYKEESPKDAEVTKPDQPDGFYHSERTQYISPSSSTQYLTTVET